MKQFESLAKENYSNLTHKDIRWIYYLLYGVLAIFLINIAIEVYAVLWEGRLSINNMLTTISLIIVVVYLGYYGISQSQILLPNPILARPNKKDSTIAYAKQPTHHLANADKVEVETLKKQLVQLLETEQPYLNENSKFKNISGDGTHNR